MKNVLVGILGLGLTQLAFSQTSTKAPGPYSSEGKDAISDKKTVVLEPEKPKDPRFWVDLGGQIWWVKSAPVSVPTLTTYSAGSTSEKTGFGGEVGVRGTTILSPSRLHYNPFVGGEANIGGWLDKRERLGIEIGGLLLENRTAGVSDFSNGTHPLRVPFNNVPPGDGFPVGKSSFVLADPGFAQGGQSLSSSLHLWGLEGNALYRVSASNRLDLSLLGGYRYLNLKENLTITSNETVPSLFEYRAKDMFTTGNQFSGGQLGAKAQAHLWRFDAAFVAKVALGDDYETLSINGSSTDNSAGRTISTRGGIFTQKTNIGKRNYNEFCVVPEGQLQLGYNLNSRIRFYVGYDILFLDNVARPGNQIDRTVNLTGNSLISGNNAGRTGAARPRAALDTSNFWAQGVTAGAQFKF